MMRTILNKKVSVYFISPHVDDALLSAGSFMEALCKKVPVHLVTVFSDCKSKDKDSSFAASAKQSIAKRKAIEKKLLLGHKIKLHYLDLPEFVLRSNTPSLYKKLPHMSTPGDSLLKKEIAEQLTNIIQKKSLLFCPLGIGGHIDHVIVRDACMSAFSLQDIYFWNDYPYSLLFNTYKDSFIGGDSYKRMRKKTYTEDLGRKGVIVHSFMEHIKEFFSKDNLPVPIFPEVYFYEERRADK